MRGMRRVGEVVSTVILSVFYFTIFAVFAIPFRILQDALGTKTRGFRVPMETEQNGLLTLNDFMKEW